MSKHAAPLSRPCGNEAKNLGTGSDCELLGRIEQLESSMGITITEETLRPKADTTDETFRKKLDELESTYLKLLDHPDMALQSGYTYSAPLWSPLLDEEKKPPEPSSKALLPRMHVMWQQPGVMPPTIHYWALVMMTRRDASLRTLLSASFMMVATLAFQFILLAVVIASASIDVVRLRYADGLPQGRVLQRSVRQGAVQ